MESSIINISEEELTSINYALQSRYGLDFSNYEETSLKRRILRIIHKYDLESVIGLWRKLLYDKDFIVVFKDEISVGLTEMFRNPEVWVKLRDDIFPKYLGKEEINIWHAGCSTGEEVYSTSIVLQELGLLHIAKGVATDLSDKFIQCAAEGSFEIETLERYGKNYEQYNPGNSLSRYYTTNGEVGQMLPRLRNYAEFIQHNLTKDLPVRKFDIIFCRNVMIYFNDNLKMEVLKMAYDALADDGLFIIGYFDALPLSYTEYFDYYDSGFKFFKKKGAKL